MSLFEKRRNYKPFEYPEVIEFVNLMNQTFWVHNEINFTGDVQDFHTNLTDVEKEVIKRSILSIAQVEVCVKPFWGDLYKNFPKPEMNCLGMTFAESEVRHSEAYSRLITVLGYEDEFKELLEVDSIFKKKYELIENSLMSDESIVGKLLFFTIVVENSSLFSQFANVLSFTRFKGLMKNVANIISWTSRDEQVHANTGVYLINKMMEEGLIANHYLDKMRNDVIEYIKYEEELLGWIFEKGELDFYTKEDVLNFMKKRVDDSLVQIGIEPIYNITNEQYEPMKWYDEETQADQLDDFFAKRPTDYTKHDKPITKNDLF